MSNQTLLWGSVILPWFTFFFLKQEDSKRYMPVALFGALITTIVGEIALASNWWIIKDAIYPFYHVPPFTYGGFLVGIIWIFKLTYKRFWLFMVTNLVFELILSFPMDNLMIDRGILELVNISQLELVFINLMIAVVLYGYQVWQEGVFATFERTSHIPSTLQLAIAKPLPKEDEKNKQD